VNWETVGAYVGALSLGAAGVAVAASHSYRHPAGLVIGILWWAFYSGCLGLALGALFGLVVQRHVAPPPPGPPGDREPPAAAEADVTVAP
jgi:hypothetical protein